MKTRTVVHIALNAKNERVGYLICAAGRFIPFQGDTEFNDDRNEAASFWINGFGGYRDVDHFKQVAKKWFKAVRFQRVTLIGESK